jgi:CheY-like chemotaxis protein
MEVGMAVDVSRLGDLLRKQPWDGNGRVLIVEDDESTRELLAEIIAEQGCEARTAADGAAALALVQEWPPSLILLDLRLRGMDGYEFARRYRELPSPHAPIVVLSASWESARALEAIGAVERVDKPFDLQELLDVVERYTPCDD